MTHKRWVLAFGIAAACVVGGTGGAAATSATDAPLTGEARDEAVATGHTIASHEADDEGPVKSEQGEAGEKGNEGDSRTNDDDRKSGDSSDKADDDASDANDTDGPGDDEDD